MNHNPTTSKSHFRFHGFCLKVRRRFVLAGTELQNEVNRRYRVEPSQPALRARCKPFC